MALHLALFAAEKPCSGLLCNSQILASLIAVLVIVAAVVVYVLIRFIPVNAVRRKQGLPPLKWKEIGASRARGRDLVRADVATTLSNERTVQRQKEWEAEQATHEMMRLGSHVSRRYCAPHERWCLHPEQENHPPGGFDNPTVPDDWPPDLSKAVRKKKS